MKHSIQQIGTERQKATVIMPPKSYRIPSLGHCRTISPGVTGPWGKHNPTNRTGINLKSILKEY